MFKKALKRTLPFTVGEIIGFAIVYTVMGILAEINPVFQPMRIEAVMFIAGWILGSTCFYLGINLHSIKREGKDDKK